MTTQLKKLKDIDFTKVSSYQYSMDDYFNDVSVYQVVSHYIKLNYINDNIYEYQLSINNDNKIHNIKIDNNLNNCLFDNDNINVEQLVNLLETNSLEFTDDLDINNIIKDITGIDLNNYISHVWYEGGGEDYIEIERKNK